VYNAFSLFLKLSPLLVHTRSPIKYGLGHFDEPFRVKIWLDGGHVFPIVTMTLENLLEPLFGLLPEIPRLEHIDDSHVIDSGPDNDFGGECACSGRLVTQFFLGQHTPNASIL